MRQIADAGRDSAGRAAAFMVAALLASPAGLTARDGETGRDPAPAPTHSAEADDSLRFLADVSDPAAASPFFVGAFLGDARSTPESIAGAMDEFARLTGARPALVKTFLRLGDDFSERGWPGKLVRRIHQRGGTNFIALDLDVGAPEGRLLEVLAGGGADEEIRRTARGLAALGGVVLVELGWEMNGDWGYAWQGAANGADAAAARRFVEAWRRIVEVFRAEGAANVRFVFSPNTGNPVAGAAAGERHWNWYGNYYPGDAWVDYVGAHGFNGPSVWGGPDRAFDALFDGPDTGGMLTDLSRRYDKPIIIGEFATQESADGSKAAWIEGAYREMLRNPSVVGAVWFHMDKEADWRVDSSDEALGAYREAVDSPRVLATFTDPTAAGEGAVRYARR